jgi:uncharacterized membrane protein YcaP (DUF421 family)
MDIHDLLMTAGRVVLVYFFMLAVVRLLGKREVGNFTAFDLLAALMLGEVVDEIVFGDVTIIKGFTAVAVMAGLHYLNSWASYKSPLIDRITGAEPTVLIENGRIIPEALAGERMSKDELESQLRMQEVEDVSEIKKATLEPNGQLSVIKQEWAKELQKGDLKPVKPGVVATV